MSALAINGLAAGYGGGTTISDITLDVPAGTIHTIVGPNGAGKTTLLHTIAGILPATAGTITLMGRDATRMAAHHRARLGLRLMAQDRTQFRRLTVAEHLKLAAPKSTSDTTTLDRLPALATRLHHRPDQLSGGEAAMLALACALLGQPRVLLLDEPTDGLSPAIATILADLVTDAVHAGTAVLLTASRDANIAPGSDQITHLSHGTPAAPTDAAVRSPATTARNTNTVKRWTDLINVP